MIRILHRAFFLSRDSGKWNGGIALQEYSLIHSDGNKKLNHRGDFHRVGGDVEDSLAGMKYDMIS